MNHHRSVQLAGVSKQFGATSVIREVNLAVEPGELVVFVGPSGCGKSTLLRLIAGLEMPSGGSIHISGRDVTQTHPAKRGVAMVFQSYALYPHMTVAENMAFGLRMQGSPRAEIDSRVRRAAEILQLEALLERKPRQLSGGQRQRVAIGRAIVREPDVFLFDEPLSNLDAALRGQMRVEIARLHARLGTTMIYVTHDQVEAMTLASRIVVLNGGRIEQIGAPLELYHRPANLFVAGFLGSPRMNFLSARVARVERDSFEVDVAGEVLRVARTGAARADEDDASRKVGATASASSSASASPAGGSPPGGGLSFAGAPSPTVGDTVTVGIRPERLSLGELGSAGKRGEAASFSRADSREVLTLHGEATLLERLGSEAIVHVRLRGDRGETIVAKLDGAAPLAPGAAVALEVQPSACHLFDSAGNAMSTGA
jgi:multiple sugar transport system ATP-binding protein